MSWAYGVDGQGREIGYGVEARCDQPGCGARINRGMDYRCGDLGSESEDDIPGCGGHFCPEHRSLSLCLTCSHLFEGAG